MSGILRTRPRHLAMALVPALLIVALGALSAYRKIETFQPLGFEARPEAGGWRVTSVEPGPRGEAGAESLAAGDQILLVNGEGFGRLRDLGEALRAKPASELILLRDGQVETVAYELPPLAIEYPYLILAAIGIGYLLIGFYTLLRDPRRPVTVFYIWCLTSTVVYLFSPVAPFDLAGKAAYVVEEVARILLAPLTLHLFAIFPRPLLASRRLRRTVPFFYLPAAFLLALQVDLIFFDGALLFGGRPGAALPVLDRLEVLHIALFSIAAAGVLVWRLRHTREYEARRQSTWIAVGMGAGYLPFLGLYALPFAAGVAWPQPVTAAALLPLALVPLTFAYAILRYKLWDIGVIVRHSISLSLTVLIGVFGFALANLMVNRLVPEQLDLGRNLLTFLSGLTIAGLLVPTHRGLSASLERLQYRGSFGRRRALSHFGRELLRERDLGRLCVTLAQQLHLGLDLKRTNFFVAHEDQLAPVKLEPGLPDALPAATFDEEFWEADYEALTGVEFPSDRVTVRHRLYAAGYRYAFPLKVRDKTIGVAVTTQREGEIPLSSDDLELVRNLLDQAALAIENAQLLNQVHRQLDEVVRLQRFSQGIIESSPAGIAVLDGDGRLRSANAAFHALVGAARGEITGRPLGKLLPGAPLPAPDEGIREISFLDASGRERYVQVSTAPLQEDDEEGLRVLVLQDVSDRVEMENALKEKDRLAALGMLAAGVAHEVNTPITGISSYAQMLIAETPENDPRHALLRKVEKQTFRAAQIVTNLLEFARNRQPEQSSVALVPMISECLELLKERLAEHRVALAWSPPAQEIRVTGNEGELLQVMTNLTVNAIDAMAAAGGTLKVDIASDDRWVWIGVEDDGPGISPQKLERIFQPFFSSKLGTGGTGLGLSITYNIVRRHGGDIRVISQPGEGTRFVVELPRERRATSHESA